MFKTYETSLIPKLYHVGTMDITKKSNFSLEWNHLSVSICPDAWIKITEGSTNGKFWCFEKKDMKLLDYYALTDKEKSMIREWSIENGYVVDATLYKSMCYDEEGIEYYSLYQSKETALREAYNEEDNVKEYKGLLPTEKLKEISLVAIELLNINSIITQLYAEKVLDYDGIYWDEELDIPSYSAPRGCIFNNKINTFKVTEV